MLGFLGRLEPIKGLNVLLEATGRIGSDRVRVRVGGAGAPDYEAALKARFAGPGVEFIGHVVPAKFLAGVDALVVPSLCEDALPRVAHEAIGLGVPVIGAAIGGIPEIIRDGVTGFLVPPGDSATLERLVRRLLDAPPDWTAMSVACAMEGERFTFERIFAAYRSAWIAAIAICRTTGRPS